MSKEQSNLLLEGRIEPLILKFAVPAVIGMLVSALYNIVDQIFIGQSVGMLGNAATNVSFPLVTICASVALLIGVGSAANFSLQMGQKNQKEAARSLGSGLTLLTSFGIILAILTILFLEPLLNLFGATPDVLPYAMTYTKITSLGFPFFILSTGGMHLIRADGRPTLAMISALIGALLNVILDPIFIFGLDMGMAGAALATIIGQCVSGIMVFVCLTRAKSVKLEKNDFNVSLSRFKLVAALGAAPAINQLAIMIVQVAMNNTLTHYGALSEYGSDIPLAVVGVISKVNVIFLAFTVGIAQGAQPIVGYNYGAKQYHRVKEVYYKTAIVSISLAILAFISFQLFPRQIISIFGSGSELYFEFATQYFRIFMFMTLASAIHPLTANFFTSLGKARVGAFISITRQLLFSLPLILILPTIMGIDGVLYAGPVADTAAVIVSIIFIVKEFKLLSTLEKEENEIKLKKVAV